MKLIPLTQGQSAQVDDCDYEELNKFKWFARWSKCAKTFYVGRNSPPDAEGKSKCILMHRQVVGVTDPMIFIDHEDHNGLNNRRSNLRVATRQQNRRNSRKASGCSSVFKGVSWNRNKSKYEVYIRPPSTPHNMYLGCFESEIQAAITYNLAATKYFGEFACLNLLVLPISEIPC